MKVLVYSAKEFEIPYLTAANNGKHKLTFIPESLNSKTAIKAVGFDAISIFSSDDANFMVIEKLKEFNIKYITLRSTGYDNANINAASRLNIKVANVPEYSPHAIAEHAVALLLALNRKINVSNTRVKNHNFNLNNLIGFDLNEKTVGVIGTGKIGSVFTKIMNGFGCKLLGFDRGENKTLVANFGMEYVDLETLCEKADIISLHVPLNADSQYLIDENCVEKMKPGVIIINTARGMVINTEHIINGLQNKTIGGLAMDVYENEKNLFFKDRSTQIPIDDMFVTLNAMPNVLITGHHAFLTDEALTNIAETTIYNLDCWSEDKASKNELYSLEAVTE
ncbi:2-hydroxyacid dehydrogenase [Lacinutrix sp. MedPE-SW]|uniref:2-hydroxyacid dehydrogenase n=1 Tax=Lacinutrix sp. MedPE-SW TaxID=1860087 RepID=UPI000917B88B|nr:2-hydroxyacid dehydrogenase [Lacinutrix sp. MedPE-SW]OIQ18754.1 MAG: hydroxyacid dehydrogenase [Lacinutrix sp. MedPE-SW]